MGTVNSGVGLVSGLNIRDLVNSFIALERRPANILKARIDQNARIRDALQSLSLKITAANLSAGKLAAGQAFAARAASASSGSVVPSAGPGAALGSFTVTPRSLAATSQLLSSGFSSTTQTVSAGVLKIAQGGFVDRDARLNTLNAGAGVRAGSIRITDQAGGSAVVDLSGAVTIRQVVDQINATSGVNVVASLEGDRLRLTDNSGGGGTLAVTEVGGGGTASDLGLFSLSRNGSVYTGQDVLGLGAGLDLRVLNDGNGVRNVQGLADFSLSAGAVAFDVNLDGARTIGDVLDRINNNAGNVGGRIQASVDPAGDRLRIVDTDGAPQTVTLTVLNNSGAARDLGLASATTTGSTASGVGGTLTGTDVLAGLGSVLIRSLKGGNGATAGTIAINGTNVDLSAATTLEDVVVGINGAGIAGVSARVNNARHGIVLTKTTAGALDVSDQSGNLAASLGIAVAAAAGKNEVDGGDLDLQYISETTRLSALAGGAGVPKGLFRIVDGNGLSANVDLSNPNLDYTVGDVIRTINTRGLAVSARLNDTGDGILIERTGGTSSLQVLEVNGGTTAAALRLRTDDGGAAVDGSFATRIELLATDKLSDVLTKIQTSGAPVNAQILSDGSGLNPFRLSLTSKQSGLAGELLLDGGSTGLVFSTVSRARDAVVLFGSVGPGSTPVQLTSGSNAFANITPGVTANVVATSADPVTVSVRQNSEGIAKAVQEFVDAFNEVRSLISENDKFDSTTNRRGIFFADSTVRLAAQQLNAFAIGVFRDTGSTIRTLGEIGVVLKSEGTLSFDESKLNAALAADSTNVERFFTAANGVVARFQSLTDQLTQVESGLLTGREFALSQTIDRQNRNFDRLTALLAGKERRLYNQFYGLELSLSRLQAQQGALVQLSSIATSLSLNAGGTAIR